MGKEADVEAFWPDGGSEAGRLQFEPPKLIFRGAKRRVFEGGALADVRAEGADLILGDGARFRLPRKADGWVEAILRPKGRLQKLGVTPASHIALVNLDDGEFLAELGAIGAASDGESGLDLAFLGADSHEELARVGPLVGRLKPKGAIWVVSLKGKALTLRDVEVMAAAKAFGLVDVKVCAFSETKTALKFVRRQAR